MPTLGRGDVGISIEVREPSDIPVLRVTSFLYDLVLLHDVLVVGTMPRFEGVQVDDGFWKRSGRGLSPSEQLLLHRLRYGSPLKIDLGVQRAVAAAGLVASIATSIAIVTKLPLEREKLRAEIAQVQAETFNTELETARMLRDDFDVPVHEFLRNRKGEMYATYQQIMDRLSAQGFVADALRVHRIPEARR
jgi:hypothetical protein